MHEQLDLYGVTNSFEVYSSGNHVNHIVERFKDQGAAVLRGQSGDEVG